MSRASRRHTVLVLTGVPLLAQQKSPAASPQALSSDFPREDATLAREVVSAAHFDEKKVRELVTARPSLANAWFDWGFGDWESALGAASHTGRRAIAEFLIAQGARIDIFAAAMLGMTDVVKAFIAAQPGIQRTFGPHSIPLLDHAKAGGPQAAATVQYLEQLGDAGERPATSPFPQDRHGLLTGRYKIEGDGREIEIKVTRNGMLQIESAARDGFKTPRNLFHKGGNVFFPTGAPSIGFRFDLGPEGKSNATTLSILAPSGAVTAVARRS